MTRMAHRKPGLGERRDARSFELPEMSFDLLPCAAIEQIVVVATGQDEEPFGPRALV